MMEVMTAVMVATHGDYVVPGLRGSTADRKRGGKIGRCHQRGNGGGGNDLR
jgi:hypothetical protein